MKIHLYCAAVVLWGAAAHADGVLVPAAREFVPGEGELAVTSKVTYSILDWFDFDRVGQCLAEAKTAVSRDPKLPPEGYRLRVGADSVEIAAADGAGEFYARQTLRQLAVQTGTNSIAIPRCAVRDWPAYRWRGLMIDEARRFLGKEIVLKILDEMAMHKLNVLHWHLVDDQGWRLEIRRHPELVEYGAVRPRSVRFGMHASWKPPEHKFDYELNTDRCGPFFYTHDDVREILEYAKRRFITVVPEIELPGHVRALLAAHPEFICEGASHGREPAVMWGVQKEVLCVGNDAAVKFFEDVFDEVCELFPDAPFIHIGGDECPRDNWKKCPRCQARIRAEGLDGESGLQAWITTRMVRYLEKKGRRAVGWDEILAGDVPAATVGMSWRASAKGGAGTAYVTAAEAVARGHDMVMAPNRFCYLNRMQGVEHDPYPYYSPWPTAEPLTLEGAYSFDPCEGIPREHRGHVLGGQICVWGESTFNIFDFEWKAWPRGCALAEVFWLGDAKPGFGDFLRRMAAHRTRLLDAHVNCAPVAAGR